MLSGYVLHGQHVGFACYFQSPSQASDIVKVYNTQPHL